MEPFNIPSRKGYDPGWNDPPMLSSAEQMPKKRSLNKRVAFPLGGQQPVETAQAAAMPGPPPATNRLETRDDEAVEQSSTQEGANAAANPLKLETVENFRQCSEGCQRRSGEILKRLEVMEGMWEKLPDGVQKDLNVLSRLLVGGDRPEADKAFSKLAMASSAVCSPFIVGIKYLVSANDDS